MDENNSLPPAEPAIIAAIRNKRHKYRDTFLIGRGLGLILMLYVGITSIPSNIKSAPAHEIRTVLTSVIIGVLGIVPGVLSLYGFERASASVSIGAGSLSALIALSSLMFRYWVDGA